MNERYYIRTFGCQMNEHDSERIAGLLEAQGMEPANGPDDADLVVLNTCAVRENADNKLYGTLGHLATTKARRGLTIAVGGCLAQKDQGRVLERAAAGPAGCRCCGCRTPSRPMGRAPAPGPGPSGRGNLRPRWSARGGPWWWPDARGCHRACCRRSPGPRRC